MVEYVKLIVGDNFWALREFKYYRGLQVFRKEVM